MLPHFPLPLALPPTPSLDDSHVTADDFDFHHGLGLGLGLFMSEIRPLTLEEKASDYDMVFFSGPELLLLLLQRIEAALVVCLDFNFSHLNINIIPFTLFQKN